MDNTITSKLCNRNTDYYSDKLESLQDIFGVKEIKIEKQCITVGNHSYPVIDDVIVLLEPQQYPLSIKNVLNTPSVQPTKNLSDFAEDIQFTFGAEWQTYSTMLPEHKDEFALYFDIVDISNLINSRVCDLGCGIGRWSYFLKEKCRELVLVDFSEAIFVARRNLNDTNNAIFFMGDIKRLPFRNSFADFLFCLGVLHHLPVDALNEVRLLKNCAPTLLIYLYYALDNRPFHFHILLDIITLIRKVVSKIRNHSFRTLFSFIVTFTVYLPFIY